MQEGSPQPGGPQQPDGSQQPDGPQQPAGPRRVGLLIGVAAAVYVADVITKIIVVATL